MEGKVLEKKPCAILPRINKYTYYTGDAYLSGSRDKQKLS